MNLKVEISWASLWRVLAMFMLVVFAFKLREVVLAILLSVFISSALSGTVTKLERFNVPRILGSILIFLVALSAIAFLTYTVLPITIIELNALLNNLNGEAANILGSDVAGHIGNLVNPNLGNLANVLLAGEASLLDIIGTFLGGATYFFTVLVLSFYLTVSHHGVRDFIRAVFPRTIEDAVINLYERTSKKIGRWFHAQLVLSLIVGVTVWLGLSLLGVKYALTLATLAAVFELVPVIGPIFSGAVAVIIAASGSLSAGIYVFILFVLIQQIENNVLVPLLLRRAIEIHPVVILISLLGGLKLAGLTGMLLAIPTAVIVVELLDEWGAKKTHPPAMSEPQNE